MTVKYSKESDIFYITIRNYFVCINVMDTFYILAYVLAWS